MTAWKRQAGGAWKVMFDQGVSRRDSAAPRVAKVKHLLPFPPKQRDTTGARAGLCALDTAGLDAREPAAEYSPAAKHGLYSA